MENTGDDCPEPPLPAFGDLIAVSHLPNPFEMSDGTPITTKTQWRCRRAQIKAELEAYDVGAKPGKPSTVEASLDGNTVNITVGEAAQSFSMTATINRPVNAPDGPIPAIIGINTYRRLGRIQEGPLLFVSGALAPKLAHGSHPPALDLAHA